MSYMSVFNSFFFSFFSLLVLGFLFFGSFCCGFFGRFFGKQGSVYIIFFCIGISIFFFFFNFLFLVYNGLIITITGSQWVIFGLELEWCFFFDLLSVEMGLLIVIITFFVLLYSYEYMWEDPHFVRFFCEILLFSFFMCFLAISGNLVQFFIGWEGVGIVSFLLVGFWYTRIEAVRSAFKAVIFNKIGDIFFLLGCISIYISFGTFDFSILSNFIITKQIDFIDSNYIFYSLLFFFFAAMGKSAQLFLHAWLPDAMEGPTPVSALLHSATMVTAGIYLMLRISVLYLNFNFIYLIFFITLIGCLTSIFGSTVALFQYDVKKIIAYSTCSQLGFMLSSFGMLNIIGTYTHLINHAFFKSLLFLCCGVIIHDLGGEQDLRRMGNFFFYMPLTYISFLIGNLGLVGFPFLSGYYSKDFILLSFISYPSIMYQIIGVMLFFSSCFTILYSVRIIYFIFFNNIIGCFKQFVGYLGIYGVCISVVFVALSIGTIFVGFLLNDLMLGIGSPFFIFFVKNSFSLILIESVSIFVKLFLVSFLIVVFFFPSFFFYYISFDFFKFFKKLCKEFKFLKFFDLFFYRLWFFSEIYIMLVRLFYKLSFLSFVLIDRGFLERLGPFGLVLNFFRLSRNIDIFNTKDKSEFFISYFFFSGFFLFFLFLFLSGILVSFFFFFFFNYFFII